MRRHLSLRGPERSPRPTGDARADGRVIFPIRFDGEPVTDPAFALPLPADFRPWEQVVEDFMDGHAPSLSRAA